MGTTPPLVLMPGLDGSGRLFDRFTAALPPGLQIRVVRYPKAVDCSLSEHAAVVRAVIGGERVILVAESFSGLVALQLLREGGVDVEKVIFVASFSSSPRRLLRLLSPLLPFLGRGLRFVPTLLWRYFCLGREASPAQIRWLRAVVADVGAPVLAHRLRLIAGASVRAGELHDIPAFHLQASGDRLVPPGSGDRLRHSFRHLTTIQVAGPHFLLQARPVECATLMAGICRLPHAE